MRHFFMALLLAVATAAQASAQIPAPPDVAAPPADAEQTASGLASKIITPGPGKGHPTRTDLVTVHYTGWTADGKMFDTSRSGQNKPVTVPLDKVIAGWSEGVQLMAPGETRRFWIPEALTYRGTREPRGTVVFDVELLSFTPQPQTPPDIEAPPADATKTASGLAYKVLAQGTGGRHPSARSQVTVHYTGWTTDGKMFDSSVMRGEPTTFTLDSVIAGWTEGLQLMVEGEKARFWIPENIAYQGKSAPYGMLVFDVELLRIQ